MKFNSVYSCIYLLMPPINVTFPVFHLMRPHITLTPPHLRLSHSALCGHYCGSPGQVRAKHAGPHLHNLILISSDHSLCCQCSSDLFFMLPGKVWAAVLQNRARVSSWSPRGWLHIPSFTLNCSQFTRKILVLSQKHLFVCSPVQRYVNCEVYMATHYAHYPLLLHWSWTLQSVFSM